MRRRYLPLAMAAAVSTPVMLMVARAPHLPFGVSNDLAAGLIAGVGIGLSIIGLLAMAGQRSDCRKDRV